MKTSEALRDRVVEMLKAGATYSQVTKETGLSKPVVWSIKKESGLPMNPKNEKKAAPAVSPPSSQPRGATLPRARGDGVAEFQPTIKKVKAVPVQKGERIHIQCDQCGVVLEGEPGDTPPDKCPECGR